jgi:hypothetical protein
MRWVFVATMVLALACAGLDREQGVVLPSQLDAISLGYIEQHHLLEEGESVRCYYDDTMSLDGSVITLVTDRRLIRWEQGRITALALADVATIDRVDEKFLESWLVSTASGEAIKIEVALMNGGDVFDRVLRAAWTAARASGPAPEPVPGQPAGG